jgi:hypothetical protein
MGSNHIYCYYPIWENIMKVKWIKIVKISKLEMEYLIKNGIKFGENGMCYTTSRHRRNYYLTESNKNMSLLNEYRKNSVASVK